MTKVMRIHGLNHLISAKIVLHFFSVSYVWETERAMEWKASRRDELLSALRDKQEGIR
jgi:hypothetical protein